MSSTSLVSSSFRIAICGAGVAGLILAVTLGSNIPVDLYETHSAFTAPGVGINMWRRALEILEELGLLEEMKDVMTRPPDTRHGPYFRRGDIPEGGYEWFHQTFEHGPSHMHRQHMIDILQKHLPASCKVHFSKKLVSYTAPVSGVHTSVPITLHFADGSTATTDLFVGADGIRSAVRRTMFESAADELTAEGRPDGEIAKMRKHMDAMWTGMLVWRALVPAENLRKLKPDHLSLTEMIICCGRGKNVVSYPVSQGTMVNVAAYTADRGSIGRKHETYISSVTKEQLLNAFEGVEPDLRTLLECCENVSTWALHIVDELPFCVKDRVVLIGDACHAMTPHFGSGAGQAMESETDPYLKDAFILGRLLADPRVGLAQVPKALKVYQDIRLPFTSWVARGSFNMGWMYLLMAPGYYDGTRAIEGEAVDERGVGEHERKGMERVQETILREWEWLGECGALEVWAKAEAELNKALAEE
ncbi:hypothetical protein HYDPIDRAFT_29357 [Hydnomerulius pinastri MD-312]|uniref:FAD-binding domain-containing protein n=1 Tax=Hydnomerulius pinastri MD-312 TaxID=994086 RepID=A0A0C9WEQ6_9AGAM|nr:hypothetical protein HYDPIDRAFT_29357 [Hydnomerulius pinastri MD-312]